ncbi:MAG: hemerythrin domain-containing protein, partial [Chitinophagaceae bacterium]|nr:hemerythrin domain-containing protein [Chitinophagaceae bacterium]
IVNTHHNYVRKYLPEIKAYATKVAQVHGANHPELKSILENVLEMSEDLTEHIEYEEKQLFPLIKKIANAKTNDVPYTPQANEKFEIVVKDAENEHEAVGQQLVEIRTLSKDYATPEDACASYKLLYKMLDEFENDLHIHIHLENNILFPKTIEIEKSLA